MALAVNEQSKVVKTMAVDWDLSAALLGGTRAMRAAGTKYLPKWPKEADADYTTRINVAVLFPGYKRTVQTLASKPFSRPVTLSEDMSPQIRGWCDNISLEGTNLHAFSSECMELVLGYGLGGILIDYQARPEGLPNTRAAEAGAGLRPYWVLVRPHQILGSIVERTADHQWRLVQLRILEIVEEPDGDFGTKDVEQVRVLTPGFVELWRANDKGAWELFQPPTPTPPLDFVPFVPLYGEKLGMMVARPPLIEVAYLNVAHWQSASDQQNILHVARVPILTVTGIDDPQWEMTLGVSSAIKLPNPDSKMAFVEHGGAAVEAGSKDLESLEERMRQAGAELLVLRAGQVTATQVSAENAMGMCVLQELTQSLQDALNRALEITAAWVGDPAPGTVKLFNDFAASSLAEASAQIVLQWNQAGKLSDETTFAEFQRRGIIDADHTWDDERERVEGQGVPTTAAGEQAVGPPTSSAVPAVPAIDAAALGASIAAALAPALEALSTAAPPTINVTPAPITVNVPEQPAPVVNITPAPITVEAPQVTINPPAITVEAPVVNVAPPDVAVTPAPITVNSPPVNVVVERGTGKARLIEDDSGKITGMELN